MTQNEIKVSLMFVPDGSMYVYYAPTHWRPATHAELEALKDKISENATTATMASASIIAGIDRQIAEAQP